MIRVSSERRASAAARTLPTISSVVDQRLAGQVPAGLGSCWSSSWMALAPACSNVTMVRWTLERIAEPGISIHDQRQGDRSRIRRTTPAHLLGADQPEIGPAERGIGNRAPER